ncbi:MAG: division/cell wall cluster transcriptional repressor MraZ [Xanthomonadales bacterium]|nr:division/cell wall cluster transcriptional repressor MraZ [Gammaproteobacteria bacterium]NNE06183.1 division/cell wall cluster transcriptional repressor MraZ [Xanthomonadales bacterium]NNL95866.1 division/cell wall cluster transcriptional repressor MraZ [Xanthomonadales bacterium]
MYFGETAINLDAKGRLAIPTRYRELIAEQCAGRMVLTYSAFDSGALWLYPEQEWQRVRDEVMRLSTFKASHRGLQRRLVGSATPVEPDGSGRIQLPLTLRQVAGLEKHVVFLGMGSRFEIWNETTLGQKRREEEMSINEQASEEMAKLVL